MLKSTTWQHYLLPSLLTQCDATLTDECGCKNHIWSNWIIILCNLRVDLCEGNWRARLSVHQSAQSGLALDDTVWDTHLAAQSWQENDELRRKNTGRIWCPSSQGHQTKQAKCTGKVILSCERSLLRVKKLVCFDPHRGFRWRNSNIIARDDLINLTNTFYVQGNYHAYLNWIHIMGNDDQLGFLALHQRGDSIHTLRKKRKGKI